MSVPLLALLTASVLLAFGTWGTLRKWRGAATEQLHLDQRVGHEALILRAAMGRIEAANLRIQIARTALGALMLTGPLASPEVAPLRALIRAEVLHQDAERAAWEIRRVTALRLASVLPEMDWHRPPEDLLGPRPLERDADQRLVLRTWDRSRRARGEVFAGRKGSWHARWF